MHYNKHQWTCLHIKNSVNSALSYLVTTVGVQALSLGCPIASGPCFAEFQVPSASRDPPTSLQDLPLLSLSALTAYQDFKSHFYHDFEKWDILEIKHVYNKTVPVSKGCKIRLSDCACINRHARIITLENISFALYYKTVFTVSSFSGTYRPGLSRLLILVVCKVYERDVFKHETTSD